MSDDVLTRLAPASASTWNEATRTVDLVLSVGASVPRYDERGEFDETLDLRGAAVPEVLPLLDSHNRFALDGRLGEVRNVRMERGKLIGTAKLSASSPMANRIAAELSDGAKYGVSIGYRVDDSSERIHPKTQRREKVATAFTILEASLVAIPADQAATTRNLPHMTESTTNPVPVTPPPPAPAAPVMTRAQINGEVRSIAKTAGLTSDWADQQIDAEATLDAVRAAALAEMQTRSAAAGSIRTTSASIVQDHTDPVAIRSAMADALAHRLAPGVVKLEGRAVEYRGHRLLDLVGDLAVANGERINVRDSGALLERAIGAHSTSDFPLLLSEATNKSLLAQYAVAQPTYRKWAQRKSFNDFKDHQFLRVGDFPAFSEIHENGEVKYGSISENAEKVRKPLETLVPQIWGAISR